MSKKIISLENECGKLRDENTNLKKKNNTTNFINQKLIDNNINMINSLKAITEQEIYCHNKFMIDNVPDGFYYCTFILKTNNLADNDDDFAYDYYIDTCEYENVENEVNIFRDTYCFCSIVEIIPHNYEPDDAMKIIFGIAKKMKIKLEKNQYFEYNYYDDDEMSKLNNFVKEIKILTQKSLDD